MPIVAISMPKSDLKDLERIRTRGNFSNRSEVMRHALHALIQEQTRLEDLSGTVTTVITIVYHEEGKDDFCNSIQHTHGKMITAMMHSHSQSGDCIEVFVMMGAASEIREFVDEFRSGKQVSRIYINVIGE